MRVWKGREGGLEIEKGVWRVEGWFLDFVGWRIVAQRKDKLGTHGMVKTR